MVEIYLETHRPRRSQFGPRGRTASGIIVMHTAESTPDTIGIDQGAEGVAAFIAGRAEAGSYHRICDADTIVPLVRFSNAAWGDGTGSNSHAIHISAATQAARWPHLPRDWVEGTVRNMARAAHEASDYVESIHKIRIPAKRVSRAVSDQPGEGFISHGERDPGRRSDPGAAFPWEMFFDFYTDLERGGSVAPKPVETDEDPTRGPNIDLALRRINRALDDLESAKGSGERGKLISAAEVSLVVSRRSLRQVKILNMQEA